MKLIVLFLLLPPLGLVSCSSTGASKKKDTTETRETSRLGSDNPDIQIGGYYRLRKGITGFYFNVPGFTEMLPARYLMRGHIVQLLDPSATNGWARVKNEDLQIGYVKFENLKIVPWDKQPEPKKRDPDELLNQRLGWR